MREMQRKKTFNVRSSLSGLLYVIVCIMAFLFVMELIVVAVRFVVGLSG